MAKAPTTTVTPRRPLPPKFVTLVRKDRVYDTHSSVDNAVVAASRAVQPSPRTYDCFEQVGIYQLVKVVRRKVTPVEVEEVACCKPPKEEK